MRSLSILLAALLSLITGSALAADVVAAEPAASINWSGAYIGAVAGYGWNKDKYHYIGSTVDFDVNGFVGGLTGGYNWQMGQFIFGLEGDVSYANVDGDVLAPFPNAPCFIEGCTAKVSWFGTGRARVGYAFENFLPYATGGFAVGHVKGSADLGACGFTPTCSYSDTRWGWSAGAGVEWAMTQQISFKAEYLHVDLGKPSFDSVGLPSTDPIKFDTVRVGINYHF
ncbi:porin family protein [Mesorhizobium sp. B3-2-1]|uniref:outer membrane protein n=1 Tax=unclassified Mesorhizobium TaxID=325217 RepID=UPI001128B140|nr:MULTISPECIES: outer membrane protein [unclassified Mesorhizobium]MBZ9709810.1 porin family protein [Mesorhizobium sp. ESP7-2]TPI28319.1 porin family protein [Mesorhizobium sp. B3-2-1]